MKTRRTVIFSLLVFVLGLSLLMMGSPGKANAGALTQAEWEDIAGSIDGYIQNQYVANDDGELGFLLPAAEYKALVDSNNDGTVCGVGDDMANRPVLVDNLITFNTLMPGTSLRNQWNGSSTTINGLSVTVLTALRDKVIAHREAGFSDDITIY